MRRVASTFAVRGASPAQAARSSGRRLHRWASIQVAPQTARRLAPTLVASAAPARAVATGSAVRSRALATDASRNSNNGATAPGGNGSNGASAAATATAESNMAAFADLTLDEILNHKRAKLGALTAVAEDDTVFSAIGTMEKQGIGAVLVKNGDGQYTGIFSERDYMRKVALQGLQSRNTSVKKVMTAHPVIVPSSTTAIEAMELMTERRFRHVPVRHDASGEVVGIVSIGDIMANVLKEYKESATYMRDMVSGKYSS